MDGPVVIKEDKAIDSKQRERTSEVNTNEFYDIILITFLIKRLSILGNKIGLFIDE